MPEETSCAFTGSQTEVHPAAIRPVHERILLARLRPGQEIDLEAHCTKGEGQEHAKWSPVATAWYKLLPEVVLRREVMGDDADALAAELPGLVVVQGKGAGRCAEVGDARKHDKLLEKASERCGVCRVIHSWRTPGAADPWADPCILRFVLCRRCAGCRGSRGGRGCWSCGR